LWSEVAATGGLQLRGPALQFLGETKEAVPVALRRQISGEAPGVVRPVPQVGRAGRLRWTIIARHETHPVPLLLNR